MTVLTASTPDQSALTDIQRQSCLLCGIQPQRHILIHIDPKYPRPYSWFKIQTLLHHLHYHEEILWMDADSMMVTPLPQITIPDEKYVGVCRDVNGWNCGVMLWRRCQEAFDALWRIYDSFDKFRDHPWFEQAAFHTMAERFDPLELPKVIFNAQEKDQTFETSILHLPARPYDHRLQVMSESLRKLKEKP